ncbi:MAG TPA: NAD(P)/FAD-dependent oxidoreductase [Micromonosporaceae bacterium]|jgi:2-polyprenyl-6-methoxyphenol hydroxylase-like FAD-dependent oxidoreductase|nr:NAD(P)/FAD-dependent oxidoreductase [Micromonosporaceae bacterium]
MRSAVVVGAGIGGLATAGALARTGWQVTLLERADRVRAERTALFLWPDGVRALRWLGLGDGLDAIATPVPHAGIRRPDGQWLAQPTGAGAVPVVVHREDLHDTLVAGLGDRVTIRTGVSVRGLRTAAGDRPVVTDGRSEFEADLVVAADGVDSAVRQRLAPEAAAASAGCAAWRAVIPWYRAPHLSVGGETLGAGYRFVAVSLGDRGSSGASSRGGIYWVATAVGAPRPEPPATQLALLRRWFADWHGSVGDLLAATEPEDLVQQDVRELRPLPHAYAFPSGSGGVVLLGDAAHAMPHHLGQGACLTLEDAATLRAVLHDAIPGHGLRAAIRRYGELRRPPAARAARQTRRVGAVVQARGRLALRARDSVLGTRTLNRLLTVRTDG